MAFTLSSDWRPDHGSMRHTFDFDPLNHAAKRARKDEFRAWVRADTCQYGFYFAGEVSASWELFVDEQDRWESDTGADVDNFAKLLNDVICGPDGLLFDDVQIQRLDIAWLPSNGEGSFELTVRSSPYDVVTRPAALYEMSDRLWYPLSDTTAAGPALHALDTMTMRVAGVRAALVAAGATRAQAFRAARPLAPIAQGFHTTRAKAGGFTTHDRQSWTRSEPRPRGLPEQTPADYEAIAAALMPGL